MIKAVIFDCFGVLTTDTWRQFLENLPAGADIDSARQAHRAYNAGTLTKADCAKQISQATGGHTFTELDDALEETFTKNTALLKYIAELHSRGIKIGILSNVGSNWIRDRFLTPAEQATIDDFTFSYEVGLNKPDPKMYQLVCKNLSVQPPKALFIDDKEVYCQAARDCGLQAVCYQDFPHLKAAIETCLEPAST